MSDETKIPSIINESFRPSDDLGGLKSQRPLDNQPIDPNPVYVGPITAVTPPPPKEGETDKGGA